MKKLSIVVQAKRASNNDPKNSVTYRTSDFPSDVRFTNGEKCLLQLDTGDLILVKASRNATTLYSGRIQNKVTMPLPEYAGDVVSHRIVAIFRVVDI